MMKKQSLWLPAALAVASWLSAGTANAQALIGTFTLPYEVRWGSLLLPAGEYTIEIDSAGRFGKLSTRSGAPRGFVMAKVVEDASRDHATVLLVTQGERQRVVRSLNWRQANRSFVYEPFTKAELERLAQAGRDESMALRVATR